MTCSGLSCERNLCSFPDWSSLGPSGERSRVFLLADNPWISLPYITFLFPPPPDFLMCVMFHFLSFPPKEQTTRYPNHLSLCEPTTQSASEGTEEDIRQREVTEQAVCLCQLTLENYRPKMMNITYSLSLITFREWNEEESTHIWSAFPAMYTEAKDDTRTQPKWKNEADGPF